MTRARPSMLLLACLLGGCGAKPPPSPSPPTAIVCRVVVPATPRAAKQWTLRVPHLPESIEVGRAVRVGDFVFVRAGAQEVWSAPLTEHSLGSWTRHPLPQPIAIAFGHDGYLYGWAGLATRAAPVLAGGALGPWQDAGPMPPEAVRGANLLAVGDTLYAVGGAQRGSSEVAYARLGHGTIEGFKPTTPLPQGLDETTLVVYGGYLFVLGGMRWPWEKKSSNGGYDRRDFTWLKHVLSAKIGSDGSLGPWLRAGRFPARAHAAATIVGDDVVMIGGDRPSVQAGYYLDDSQVITAHFDKNGLLSPWRLLGHYDGFGFGGWVANGTEVALIGLHREASDAVRLVSLREVVSCGERE